MIPVQVLLDVSSKLYLKDPRSSEIGKSIVGEGIILMDELGYEAFTFKKLSIRVETTEATIYRYFENKHLFLLYLCNWYWAWLDYRIMIGTVNIPDTKVTLERCIDTLIKSVIRDDAVLYIDERLLQQIIIKEGAKAYLSNSVDNENHLGFFHSYKKLVNNISQLILSYSPKFNSSHALATTLIECIHQQRFFALHLPKLSDNLKTDENLGNFVKLICFGTINEYKNNLLNGNKKN